MGSRFVSVSRRPLKYDSGLMKCSYVLRFGLILGFVVALSACGTVATRHTGSSIAPDQPVVAACLEWFGRLDQANQIAGVSDAEAVRIQGYPYLSVSRLLAAYRKDIPLASQRLAWLYRLRDLDQQAREAELSNMGATVASNFLGLTETLPLPALIDRTVSCGERLVGYDNSQPQRIAQIIERAVVPDDYSTLKRVVGLYALVRPMLARVDRRQEQGLQARVLAPPQNLADASSYWPDTVRRGQALASRLVSSRRRDAIGLPILTPQVSDWLLQEYAPVIVHRTTK